MSINLKATARPTVAAQACCVRARRRPASVPTSLGQLWSRRLPSASVSSALQVLQSPARVTPVPCQLSTLYSPMASCSLADALWVCCAAPIQVLLHAEQLIEYAHTQSLQNEVFTLT